MDVALVNLDSPVEVRTFEKGKFEIYSVGPTTVGRATYEPGWKWSEHVGGSTGERSCQVKHVGLVLNGQAVAKMDDGREVVMRAGDFFYIPPGHDSWVVGEEPYVSLHILGSEQYAATWLMVFDRHVGYDRGSPRLVDHPAGFGPDLVGPGVWKTSPAWLATSASSRLAPRAEALLA